MHNTFIANSLTTPSTAIKGKRLVQCCTPLLSLFLRRIYNHRHRSVYEIHQVLLSFQKYSFFIIFSFTANSCRSIFRLYEWTLMVFRVNIFNITCSWYARQCILFFLIVTNPFLVMRWNWNSPLVKNKNNFFFLLSHFPLKYALALCGLGICL